jgi:SagB-type dehydrogenase family enzyme
MAPETIIPLPLPQRTEVPLEAAMSRRQSVREYTDDPLTPAQLAALLWAAQGESDQTGRRTVPSAGATHPLEIYAVVGRVEGLEPGIYRYRGHEHDLKRIVAGDRRAALGRAALGQACVVRAPASIVISAVYSRTTESYGERGVRYVHMEAGHSGQNIHLQAAAMELGTVMVGAFDDDAVTRIMALSPDEKPLYIVPIGKPA